MELGYHRVESDGRSAVQLRRSELGDAFPMQAQYTAALLLHAYLEPIMPKHASKAAAAKAKEEEAAGGGGVPLDVLQRQQAWARLSAFPDTPALTGGQWQALLARWLGHLALHPEGAPATSKRPAAALPALALVDGAPALTGLRRVHPAARQPALHGWDVLQLLAFFRVGKLADLPYPDEATLAALPLPQVWPNLGDAHEMAMQALLGGADDPAPAE